MLFLLEALLKRYAQLIGYRILFDDGISYSPMPQERSDARPTLTLGRTTTQIELGRIIGYFENFLNTEMPVARIIKFAISARMIQSEMMQNAPYTQLKQI